MSQDTKKCHKKVELTAAEKFRPITNVAVINKNIGKVVCNHVDSYMKQNYLYSTDQHGYRSGHSTATALVSVTKRLKRVIVMTTVS